VSGVAPRCVGATGDVAVKPLTGGALVNAPGLSVAVAGAYEVHRDGARTAVVVGALDRPVEMPWSALDGDDASLQGLRGDVALVLWDADRQRGTLVRDQIGGMSMHWIPAAGQTFFATELVDLLRAVPSRPAPDPAAVGWWLAATEVPTGRTLFRGVSRLDPGELVELVGRAPGRRRRWWSLPSARLRVTELDAAAAHLRPLLEQAVDRRTTREGRTALLLSGGLDSTSVLALARRPAAPPSDLLVCSTTFPDHPRTDESARIDLARAHFGVGGLVMTAGSTDALDGAAAYARSCAAPLAAPAFGFQAALMAALAPEGPRVVLDGEGGDEVFGPARGLVSDELARGHVLRAVGLVRDWPGGRRAHPHAAVLRVLLGIGVRGALPHTAHRALRRLRDRRVPPWVRRDVARQARELDAALDWKVEPGPRWRSVLLDDVTGTVDRLGVLEHHRRRAALAGALARHPLFDVDLLLGVLEVDPHVVFDPAMDRPVLRRAVADLMPDTLRAPVPKATFDTVFAAGFASGEPRVRLAALLGDPRAEVLAFADATRVAQIAKGPTVSGLAPNEWIWAAWRLCAVELWLREEAQRR
jgi:asparagine synthetase B (glutamine-hydrolysing)